MTDQQVDKIVTAIAKAAAGRAIGNIALVIMAFAIAMRIH